MSKENQSALSLFQKYVTLKLHFNDWRYDYKPGRCLSKISAESFLKRRDKSVFYRLSGLLKNDEIQQEYLISGFMMDRLIWAGDMIHEETLEYHVARIKRTNSILSIFDRDCERISDEMKADEYDLKKILTSTNRSPIIVSYKIHPETLSILDHAFNFTRFSNEDICWEAQRKQIYKYRKVLNFQNHTGAIKDIIQRHLFR